MEKSKLTRYYTNHLDNNFKHLREDSYKKVSILVEFHGWSFAHICYGYLLSALIKKYPGKIYAYEGYRLISSPAKNTFIVRMRWILGQLLNLKTFCIYKSLGIKKFIRPSVTKK